MVDTSYSLDQQSAFYTLEDYHRQSGIISRAQIQILCLISMIVCRAVLIYHRGNFVGKHKFVTKYVCYINFTFAILLNEYPK